MVIFPEVAKKIFPDVAKVVKLHFTTPNKEINFFSKNVIGKCTISKTYGAWPFLSLFRRPCTSGIIFGSQKGKAFC